MINKQLLASLFKDYTPELGNELVDLVLHELKIQYEQRHKTMVILKRYGLYHEIFTYSSDELSEHRYDILRMVYPPKNSEEEVQAIIFKVVMPIIVSNFIAHIKHNPLNKTQIVYMNVWINQLHGLGLSGTANLLDREYVHHSLSL